MCIAINSEQVIAGYINQHQDGEFFEIEDVNEYISSLWDAGCGPVRLNFNQLELEDCLKRCHEVCLRIEGNGYRIDKKLLDGDIENMPEDERAFFHDDADIARSFDLFCKLHVDFRTPDHLLDAMGFRFIYA